MAFKLLDSETVAPTTSEKIVFRKIMSIHSLQINITGNPTAVTVDLEGSLDGEHWTQLITSPMIASELAAGTSSSYLADKASRYIRVILQTLTGGTSPTVTALYEALEDRA